MTQDSDWYQQMAAAMKKRDHAIVMTNKWTATRAEAESEIQALFAANRDGEAAATEQEQ
jgi:hypothetical protein